MPTAAPRVAAILILVVAVAGCGSASQPTERSVGTPMRLQVRLDATSDAEAKIMRHATRQLAAELHAAARCHVRSSAACLLPALQHAGIGGRTSAMLLRGVVARVPAGACREYLFGLGAANDAAGDQARWALSTLYGGRSRRLARATAQTMQAARMLDRASRAASADVCAPSAQSPRA